MFFSAKVRVAVAGLTVAGGAAAAALLGPAGPAVGQSSPPVQAQIQVHSRGTLEANGASVDVPVTARCAGVDSTSIQVTVTEAVAGDIAFGVGAATVPCTGTSQTVDVLVTALNGTGTGLPTAVPSQEFDKGPAIAVGLIQVCTIDGTCATQQVEPTIKIKK